MQKVQFTLSNLFGLIPPQRAHELFAEFSLNAMYVAAKEYGPQYHEDVLILMRHMQDILVDCKEIFDERGQLIVEKDPKKG